MSRKDIFGGVRPGRAAQALAGATPASAPAAGSVRRFSAALDEMQEKAAKVEDLEKVIAEKDRAIEAARRGGEGVVEIDPALIDPSPIRDRMPASAEDEASLRASIEASGQEVPVLLRRSPKPGRYVTIYGHRRVAAAKALGRAVRAIVRDLDETAAYVAQGVENAERRDLTFIERALFAHRLANAGIAQSAIAKALATARPNVSSMIGLARSLPGDLVDAIGRGPGLGRGRWEALQAALAASHDEGAWRGLIADASFAAEQDGARFDAVMRALRSPRLPKTRIVVADEQGDSFAALERGAGGAMTIKLRADADLSHRSDGRAFGDWLSDRLAELRDAWRRNE